MLILGLLHTAVFGHAGKVSIRLPFPPGVEYDYMQDPPPGTLPIKFDDKFVVDNAALKQAEYILADRLTGVETVAVAPDGSLGIVDKIGRVSTGHVVVQCSRQFGGTAV
jgi:hypothetical protein